MMMIMMIYSYIHQSLFKFIKQMLRVHFFRGNGIKFIPQMKFVPKDCSPKLGTIAADIFYRFS